MCVVNLFYKDNVKKVERFYFCSFYQEKGMRLLSVKE